MLRWDLVTSMVKISKTSTWNETQSNTNLCVFTIERNQGFSVRACLKPGVYYRQYCICVRGKMNPLSCCKISNANMFFSLFLHGSAWELQQMIWVTQTWLVRCVTHPVLSVWSVCLKCSPRPLAANYPVIHGSMGSGVH